MTARGDLFSVEGRVACVTGASAGLGRHAANVLAGAGAHVIGVARRMAALQDWRAEAGSDVAIVQADVSNHDRMKDLAHLVSEPFGPPDILVHAAGLNTREPADGVTPQGWNATLALNLWELCSKIRRAP